MYVGIGTISCYCPLYLKRNLLSDRTLCNYLSRATLIIRFALAQKCFYPRTTCALSALMPGIPVMFVANCNVPITISTYKYSTSNRQICLYCFYLFRRHGLSSIYASFSFQMETCFQKQLILSTPKKYKST